MCLNRQDFGESTNVMAIIKENEAAYDSELIVLDTKQRRSQLGQQGSMGLEDSNNVNMMEIIASPKNGSAVEPVNQAHRGQ